MPDEVGKLFGIGKRNNSWCLIVGLPNFPNRCSMYSGLNITTEAMISFVLSILTKTNRTSVHFKLSPDSYFINKVSVAGTLFQTCRLYDFPLVTIYVSINSLVILGIPFPFGGTISNCPASANSGNGCFSNTEAMSLRTFEPSVLVFPVNANGLPANFEKYSDNVSEGVSLPTNFGGILKSLFILQYLAKWMLWFLTPLRFFQG